MLSGIMLKPMLSMVKSENIRDFFKNDGELFLKWLINSFTPNDVTLQKDEISIGVAFIPYHKEGKQYIIGIVQTFNINAEPVRLLNRFDLQTYLAEADYDKILNDIKSNLG